MMCQSIADNTTIAILRLVRFCSWEGLVTGNKDLKTTGLGCAQQLAVPES